MKRYLYFALMGLLLTCNIARGIDLKISQLPGLLNANTAPTDMIPIVDSVAGQTKQITLGQLDLRWQTLPTGGTFNQVLGKNSAVNSDVGWKTVDKTFVGLGNVDNTSDLNKPVSTATQTALNLKANASALATKADQTYVDSNLLLKQDKLPSGTDGYVLTLSSGLPTWQAASGGGLVSSVFGRTGAVTAQSGDYTKAQVGLGSVDNTDDLSKPISNATQSALNAKQDVLPAGTNGQVLTLVSGLPQWQPSSTAAPSIGGSTGSPISVTSSGISFSGTSYSNMKFIASSGGAVNVTNNPQITAGTNVGQELEIIGTSSTNTVQLNDGNGLDLNGPWISGSSAMPIRNLVVRWNGSVWYEKTRR